jgi:dienelactone hydrolase
MALKFGKAGGGAVRRRGVLHIGVTGLAAMLVQGCGGGSHPTWSGGGAGSPAPSRKASGFDPSTYAPPTIAFEELRKLYGYDSKSFLDAVLTDERTGGGIVVEDITFSDTKGGTIPAYVVTPANVTGRLPAVVFAHAAGANREPWLPEASDLAKRGMVAMVAEVPFKATGDPAADSTMVVNAVLAQRRALDLLGRRTDTDPGRLAFVGHGWGGAQAQILSALESRLSGVVVAAAGSRLSQTMVAGVQTAAPTAYLDALTRFDGARYISATAKRSVLLQFGRQDQTVPAAQIEELVKVTSGSKERKDYDTADDLAKFPAAAADRLTFLRKVLRLK